MITLQIFVNQKEKHMRAQWGLKRSVKGELVAPETMPQKVTAPHQADESPTMQGYVPEIIEVVENSIYFYADIDREKILKLNKTIISLNNELTYKGIVTKNQPAEIYLYINSHGGSIFDAFSVIDTMLASRLPVNTIIDGVAASAATLISVVGKRRYIKRHSYFLIHQISTFMFGKYSDFQDEMENLDKFMKMIKGVYKQYTGIPMSKLNEILKHDIYFDAEEALKFGLVDEIL